MILQFIKAIKITAGKFKKKKKNDTLPEGNKSAKSNPPACLNTCEKKIRHSLAFGFYDAILDLVLKGPTPKYVLKHKVKSRSFVAYTLYKYFP